MAHWMVTFHNAKNPELQNFKLFMTALRWRFEDPLADWKARDSIKMVRQGCFPEAEYTEEFQDLACCLNWLKDIQVSCFKDGLNNDVYHACIIRGALAHLHDWCILAEKAEIDQMQNDYQSGSV